MKQKTNQDEPAKRTSLVSKAEFCLPFLVKHAYFQITACSCLLRVTAVVIQWTIPIID